jgi:hypothetical protein
VNETRSPISSLLGPTPPNALSIGTHARSFLGFGNSGIVNSGIPNPPIPESLNSLIPEFPNSRIPQSPNSQLWR